MYTEVELIRDKYIEIEHELEKVLGKDKKPKKLGVIEDDDEDGLAFGKITPMVITTFDGTTVDYRGFKTIFYMSLRPWKLQKGSEVHTY